MDKSNFEKVRDKILVAIKTKQKYLRLSRLRLQSVPKEIGQIESLEGLDLSNNDLTEIPIEAMKLKHLKHLDLSNNRISEIPLEIKNLKNLEKLYIYKNRINSVPSCVGKLNYLTELKLHNNRIAKIPEEIGNLNNLNALFLNFNRLNMLPPNLYKLRKISKISIDGNNLPDTMITAAKRGTAELLTYLKSLAEDTEELYEAKLILVGEGAVGKTSLVAAIKNEAFIDNRATTHGIEICALELPHQSSGKTINLNVWDFGGQPVYRVTHQFFYSRRSLYLLLWSPRRGVELCDVEGWIKRIKLRVGNDAKILIIATHAETGDRVARIDKKALLTEYGEIIEGFHEVDSKTGYGIDDLKTIIAESAFKLPQMGDLLSRKWSSARKDILSTGKPQITFEEFNAICCRYEMDNLSVDTLADLMHDIGHIVFYGDDESLKNVVVLIPEWLTKAISYVLEDKNTNKHLGVLQHSRLRQIWYDNNIKEREHYDIYLHPYFLRLMEKYDVSYRLEGGNSSLIAQLVPGDRPELPWYSEDELKENVAQVEFSTQFDEDPPGLIPWLIVRTNHFSTKPSRHWKRGMFLEYNDHGSALIEHRKNELIITVRSAWPNYFADIIRYIIDRLINERWPGLNSSFSVPCPVREKRGRRCKGRFPIRTLQKIKRKFDKIPCMTCTTVHSVEELLTGLKLPDLRDKLGKIEEGIQKTHSELRKIESENAARFLILLRALENETRDSPRLFTLTPEKAELWNLANIGKIKYRLNLWCEMPGCQHPTCDIGSGGNGEYVFFRSKEWLSKVAPYADLIAKTLKALIPIAGSTIKVALDETIIKNIGNHIDLMEKVTTSLLAGEIETLRESINPNKNVTAAEGSGLRELYSLLCELDKEKTWGNLRRVLTPTGDYLWLCREHYILYEPDLPILN